jgi:hypothetical protein
MGAGYLSRKFILTALSLGAVFTLFAFGKDVHQLEIIIPAILAFYHAGNVSQDMVIQRQKMQPDGSTTDQTIHIRDKDKEP